MSHNSCAFVDDIERIMIVYLHTVSEEEFVTSIVGPVCPKLDLLVL